MVQMADDTDPISNAVASPDASLFVRQILTKALAAGLDARWKGEALSLLANVLMNDYLNWWNVDFPVNVQDAQDAVDEAMKLHPPGPWLALAHHAQGLIHRAKGDDKLALKAFRMARNLDRGFARGHAQFGNQKALLERESEAHAPLDRARNLNPRHPAAGYFYWAEGRAYFKENIWSNAVYWLKKSVKALPTVWYNRCYLAAAQDAAGDSAAAKKTLQDFISDPRFDQATFTRIKQLTPDPKNPAQKRVLDFVQPLLP
jgi:tetratricopeptide (TPR) repeat protein